MSDTQNTQPETDQPAPTTVDQPASDGAVQVNEPAGDVTVNAGGQEQPGVPQAPNPAN